MDMYINIHTKSYAIRLKHMHAQKCSKAALIQSSAPAVFSSAPHH